MKTRFRDLFRSNRGSVSVEFVIIVPVMLLVLLGFTELYMYMRVVSAVERTAFTLANSIGLMTSVIPDQNDTTHSNSYGSWWQEAALIAAPYPLKENGMVYVTFVCNPDTSGNCKNMDQTQASVTPTLRWQASPSSWAGSQDTALLSRVSASNLLPASWPFRAGDSAIVVEVMLPYNPFLMTSGLTSASGSGVDLPGQQVIYRRVYIRPRTPTAFF